MLWRGTTMARLAAAMVATTIVTGLAAACTQPTVVHFPAGTGGAVSTEGPDTIGPLRIEGDRMVDGAGRTVLIHGVNSVAKQPPFITPLEAGGLGAAEIAGLRADGMNGVRLGVWAAALMPTPDTIDTDYLDAVARDVEALTDAGMWVLLDFHQDVFWGMPDWATTPAAAAASDEISPLVSWIGWAAAYTTDRSVQQWEDWWANVAVDAHGGVQDHFAAGVAAVARRFADASNVMGIDLLNEPYPGTALGECVQFCPGRSAQLAEFNARVTAAARTEAPAMPLWWEPFTFGAPFPGVPTPGPGVGISFHAYCLNTDGGQPVAPSPAEQAICDGVFDNVFAGSTEIGRRWNVPRLLTEFGASKSPLNATGAVERADRDMISWFHWHGANDHPEVVRTQLVRTYAQATAGTPTYQRYDPATGGFELRYLPDHGVTAPTSIVVPAEAYPEGYDATVTGGAVTSAPQSGRLTVEADPDATEVTVRVARTPGP